MSIADIEPGAPSAPYVLATRLNGRRARTMKRSTYLSIVIEHYASLPAEVQEAVDASLLKAEIETERIRIWAESFIAAFVLGRRVPDRRGALRELDDRRGWSTAMVALAHVIDAGDLGITALAIRQITGINSDGISGSLSELEKAGIVARPIEKKEVAAA